MKKIKYVFVATFIIFISVMGLATIDNKTEKSMTEGRALTQFPDLDYTKLKYAEYFTQIGDAFSDQIASREQMIRKYYDYAVNSLGMKEVGTISIGKKNNLFNQPELIDDEKAYEKMVIQCAGLINRQAEKITKAGSVFIYINYPKKDVVMKDYLPDYYPDSSKDYEKYIKIMREHLSDNVIFVDAYAIFSESGSQEYYYKTDHHVNIRGQQLIYEKLMEIVKEKYPNVKVTSLDDYKIRKKVVDGSFNRKIGYAVSADKEELSMKPKFELEYKRNSKAPIFGKGDTYASAFMGGDYAETEVETELKNAPSIVFSGSSYTNSLESLSVASFSSMTSFDYRYNNSGKNLVQQVRERKPDYVVYIPNQSDLHFVYETFKLHFGIK